MNLNLLLITVIVVLLTMFCIILLDKLAYETKLFGLPKFRLFQKWFDCNFCKGFWISLLITIILYIVFRNNYFVLIPFMSAALIWRVF